MVCHGAVESVQLVVHRRGFAGKIPCLRVYMGIFVVESLSSGGRLGEGSSLRVCGVESLLLIVLVNKEREWVVLQMCLTLNTSIY